MSELSSMAKLVREQCIEEEIEMMLTHHLKQNRKLIIEEAVAHRIIDDPKIANGRIYLTIRKMLFGRYWLTVSNTWDCYTHIYEFEKEYEAKEALKSYRPPNTITDWNRKFTKKEGVDYILEESPHDKRKRP